MIWNRWHREQVYSRSDYWDAKAVAFGGSAVSGWPNQHLNVLYEERELEVLSRLLPQVDGVTVLDIGCGTGRTSRYLASCNATVLGIDFSARAIELARKYDGAGNPAYRVESVFALREQECFDIAISSGCLAVACRDRQELGRALTNVWTALKPGGRFLLIEPLHHGSLHFVLNMALREFITVMRQSRFRIQHVDGLHFWPIVRLLGHFDCSDGLTDALYWLGEAARMRLHRIYFADYKIIAAVKQQI
jgi:2-polyprenyl-3-methyl-5-hydroxy-6-metoxy-1,4-benzoquinol methylase